MQGSRPKASSASGLRRGGRQRHNGSGQGFVLEGRAAPIHPKPGQQMSPQQRQAWEQQQQQMMMLMASGQYPVFGQYATNDGGSPRAGEAPFVAQLIQQGAQGQHTWTPHTRTPLSLPMRQASQPHLLPCCTTATATLHAPHTPHRRPQPDSSSLRCPEGRSSSRRVPHTLRLGFRQRPGGVHLPAMQPGLAQPQHSGRGCVCGLGRLPQQAGLLCTWTTQQVGV